MFSRKGDEHILHVRVVLRFLRKAEIMLNIKKYRFLSKYSNFPGRTRQAGELEMVCHTTDAVQDLKLLCNLAELKLVLGLCNLHDWIVQNFTHIAAPLYTMLRESPWRTFGKLVQKKHKELATLQEKLVSAQVSSRDNKGQLTLNLDARDRTISCVLVQEQSYGTKMHSIIG